MLKKREKWKLGSGETVIDRANSNVHADMVQWIAAALSHVESLDRQYIREEVDFTIVIGKTTCVSSNPSDEIVYAKKVGRLGYSRFVKNRGPEATTKASVILKATSDGYSDYVIIAAFLGTIAPPEPWDEKAFSKEGSPETSKAEAVEFLSSHALIWGTESTISGTETDQCPW